MYNKHNCKYREVVILPLPNVWKAIVVNFCNYNDDFHLIFKEGSYYHIIVNLHFKEM